MTSIKINDYTTEIPASWNELDRKMLLALASMLNEKYVEYDFKIRALFILSGWKLISPIANTTLYRVRLKYRKKAWVNEQQMLALCENIGFLLKKSENKKQTVFNVAPRLTKNLIPNIRILYKKYYGPADALYNLEFGEYLTAENYFTQYLKTSDEGALDKLIATLYRRQDKDFDPEEFNYRGDRREPFNYHNIDARARKLSKIDKPLKLAIMLFYEGCRAHIAKLFPTVFTGTGKINRYGSLSLVDMLTNGDVTKHTAIKKGFLYDIMVHLQNTAELHDRKTKANG